MTILPNRSAKCSGNFVKTNGSVEFFGSEIYSNLVKLVNALMIIVVTVLLFIILPNKWVVIRH